MERLICVCIYLPPGRSLPLTGGVRSSDFGLASDGATSLCQEKGDGACHPGAASNGPAGSLGKLRVGLLKG